MASYIGFIKSCTFIAKWYENKELYARNAQQLIDELKQVDSWIKAQINTIPPQQRKLVTTHDALGYYANAYDLKIEGALQGFSTEEQPTAARVKELVTEVESTGVPTIFAEVTANDKVIATVAREANVKVSDQELYADGLGSEGSLAGSYVGMLTSNTCIIVDELGGKCTPFAAKSSIIPRVLSHQNQQFSTYIIRNYQSTSRNSYFQGFT